ncbi:CheR family methyltransferase [uncultured Cohaesibacter sp.]|uniref:CheR family methyltransferase n=1 Tax=uncultured Cohaesibacter sp. TaxID=1002546 RepID=UPI0029C7620E|nr:CheR family methyltransferase [uncultured Cohaesibacter sp.]
MAEEENKLTGASDDAEAQSFEQQEPGNTEPADERAPDESEVAGPEEDAEDDIDVSAAVRVVAIGASAGGLEPIEQFFEAMPADTGFAFVVVQHLSPNFQSMMDQLIERHTKMRITHAEDQMLIEPNVIYLNPPRTALSIRGGRLEAKAYPDTDMLSLPIDAFFTSLAEEEGEKAIGIVMSGTGSDGARGSLRIAQNGGAVIAQEPTSAKFDSMPRKVIESDAATFVADVKEMPGILDAIMSGSEVYIARNDDSDDPDDKPENRILSMLQKTFGTDFRYYKNTTVHRRILRRALLQRFANLEDYCERLKHDREELDTLYCDLLIGVTSFFRDKEAFEVLKSKALPQLATIMSAERQLRIWTPGCATGEEPYSLAILINEFAKRNGLTLNLKIFATDIHFKSLEIAANGIYDEEVIQSIPEALRDEYLNRVDGRYQVKQSLRRLVVFSSHNLLKDPPFTRIDMISCRNLMIYFAEPAQQKVLSLFHFSLRKDGVLFLGSSETVGALEPEFAVLDKRWRVFSKKRNAQLREAAFLLPPDKKIKDELDDDGVPLRETRSTAFVSSRKENLKRQALYDAYDRLLTSYAPTGFLINEHGDLVHVFGDADKYVQVRKGLFSNRLVDMVHKDMRLVFNAGIERVLSLGGDHDFERTVSVADDQGNEKRLKVGINKLGSREVNSVYLLITIEERFPLLSKPVLTQEGVAEDSADKEFYGQRIAELEGELKSTGESLQSTIEELETSNEELQATNEELMASNEELQSTNEELHSVNEELYTVSAEHQRKILELTEVTDDIENLLRSTEIGTIFLDDERRIRRFTPAATKAFNLMPHDLGRPIEHVTYRFTNMNLIQSVQDTIQSGETFSQEIEVDGSSYLLTILPYRTELGAITGAVLTVVNIQDLKAAQAHLHKEREFFKAVVDSQSDLICRMKPDTTLTFANNAFRAFFRIEDDKRLLQTRFVDLLNEITGAEVLAQIGEMHSTRSFEVEWQDKKSGSSQAWLHSHFHALTEDDNSTIIEIQSVSRNVTDIIDREAVMGKFSRITADSKQELESKIDAVLKMMADYLNLPAAMLVRLDGKTGRIDHLIGMEETGLLLGQTFDVSENTCEEQGCDPANNHCFANFSQCKHGLHPLLENSDYSPAIGTPIYMNGDLVGTLTFLSRRKFPRASADNFQPILLHIADWIGYEYVRRLQQQDLEDLNKRLESGEKRFRQLYMNTPVIMSSHDQEGRIIEANGNWLDSLGYQRDEVIGKTRYDFLTPESLQYADEVILPKYYEQGRVNSIPYQIYKKNGEVVDVEVSSTLVEGENGETESLATIVDVSARVKAERELEAQNQELKKINENLNQFTHIISHDLASPLRAIQHTATWIEEDVNPQTRQEIQAHIDRLKDQITHLGSLISDLTDYSRAGSDIQDEETINLAAELKGIFEVIGQREGITLDVAGLGRSLKTHRAPIMLVFRNLIENAVKYHDKDEGLIRVKQSELDDDFWSFSVSDDGPGIDPKYHEKILLPFRKLERKDKIPGNGMGLALVKKAIESLGGSIEIISDPETVPGTTFRFTWPKAGRPVH